MTGKKIGTKTDLVNTLAVTQPPSLPLEEKTGSDPLLSSTVQIVKEKTGPVKVGTDTGIRNKIQSRAEQIFEQRSKSFRILYDSVVEIAKSDDDKIFSVICKYLRLISNAPIATVASVHSTNKVVLESACTELESLMINRQDLQTFTATVTPSFLANYERKMIIVCAEDGVCQECVQSGKPVFVFDLFKTNFFEQHVKQDPTLLKVMVTFKNRDKILAIGSFQMSSSEKLKMKDMIETYLDLASLALNRRASFLELVDNNLKFQNLIENIPVGITVIDDSQKIIQINKAALEMFGVESEAVIGKMDSDFLSKQKDINKTIQKNIVLIGSGEQKYKLEVYLDLTAEKNAERERELIGQQIYNVSKLATIGELSAGMAHEINNPLTIIRGNQHRLKQHLIKNQVMDETIQKIIDTQNVAIDRIVNVIDGVKSLSAFDKVIIPFSTHKAIRDCLKFIEIPFEKDGIDIKLNLSAANDIIVGSEEKIRQVFINLLTNAKDAISGHGIIKISTTNHEHWIDFAVEDSGCGIPADKFNKIFDTFYSTKKNRDSTGLGLGIVKNIVIEMKGKIAVSSKEGVGTRFTISFPLAKKV